MAVRIRANREVIVCAAMSEALPGDCYLDDDVHYTLAVELGVLCCTGKDSDGADLWEFYAPGTCIAGRSIDGEHFPRNL